MTSGFQRPSPRSRWARITAMRLLRDASNPAAKSAGKSSTGRKRSSYENYYRTRRRLKDRLLSSLGLRTKPLLVDDSEDEWTLGSRYYSRPAPWRLAASWLMMMAAASPWLVGACASFCGFLIFAALAAIFSPHRGAAESQAFNPPGKTPAAAAGAADGADVASPPSTTQPSSATDSLGFFPPRPIGKSKRNRVGDSDSSAPTPVAVSHSERAATPPPDASATPPALSRTWTDRYGRQVTATLAGVASGMVRLQKPDGAVIDCSVDMLSQADREYLNRLPRTRR